MSEARGTNEWKKKKSNNIEQRGQRQYEEDKPKGAETRKDKDMGTNGTNRKMKKKNYSKRNKKVLNDKLEENEETWEMGTLKKTMGMTNKKK